MSSLSMYIYTLVCLLFSLSLSAVDSCLSTTISHRKIKQKLDEVVWKVAMVVAILFVLLKRTVCVKKKLLAQTEKATACGNGLYYICAIVGLFLPTSILNRREADRRKQLQAYYS